MTFTRQDLAEFTHAPLALFSRDASFADAIIILRTALGRCDDPAARDLLHGAIVHLLKKWNEYQEDAIA